MSLILINFSKTLKQHHILYPILNLFANIQCFRHHLTDFIIRIFKRAKTPSTLCFRLISNYHPRYVDLVPHNRLLMWGLTLRGIPVRRLMKPVSLSTVSELCRIWSKLVADRGKLLLSGSGKSFLAFVN